MITAEKQHSVSRPHAPNIEGNHPRLVAHQRYRGIRHLLGLRLQLGIAHHLADSLKIDAALTMQAKPGFRFQNLAYRVVQALAADLTAVDCLEQRLVNRIRVRRIEQDVNASLECAQSRVASPVSFG